MYKSTIPLSVSVMNYAKESVVKIMLSAHVLQSLIVMISVGHAFKFKAWKNRQNQMQTGAGLYKAQL